MYLKTEISNQIYVFIIFILNGSFIGIFFDFFRILRKSFKTSDFLTTIHDLLFCIITGSFLIYSIFTFNNGVIRLYVICGLVIGLILYLLFLSKYIIKINLYIINFFKRIAINVSNIILKPIKFILSIFKRPCKFIFINIKKIIQNTSNNLLKLLKTIKRDKKLKN